MSGIKQLALACREAALQLGQLPTEAKNRLLSRMAEALEADASAILAANVKDLEAAAGKGMSGAMLDRLRLDAKGLAGIATALREVAALPDPVGLVTRRDTRPNGIRIERVRVPKGFYQAVRPLVQPGATILVTQSSVGEDVMGRKLTVIDAVVPQP